MVFVLNHRVFVFLIHPDLSVGAEEGRGGGEDRKGEERRGQDRTEQEKRRIYE